MKLKSTLITIAVLAVSFAACREIRLLVLAFDNYGCGPHDSMLVPGQLAHIVGKPGDKVQIRTPAEDGIRPAGRSSIPAGMEVIVVDDVRDIDDASPWRGVSVRAAEGASRGIPILVERRYLRID